jgi:hypothetical protein
MLNQLHTPQEIVNTRGMQIGALGYRVAAQVVRETSEPVPNNSVGLQFLSRGPYV